MSFEKIVVCFTGVPKSVRVEKSQLVEEMRGKVSPDFNASVTHLVADECSPDSEKYTEARRVQVPVMRVEWIDEGYRANQALNHLPMGMPEVIELYRCPIFSKCVITVSGFDAEDRANLGRLIELHGGVYDGQMSRKHCTHLIAASNSGEKYRKAVQWGSIRIVASRWLRKSIESGYRQAEEHFLVASDGAVNTISTTSADDPQEGVKEGDAENVKVKEKRPVRAAATAAINRKRGVGKVEESDIKPTLERKAPAQAKAATGDPGTVAPVSKGRKGK